MENTIIIQNLNKYYGKKQALSNVNLTIERGMFGLLGRNGAGKTTLMKTLATLLHKNSGNITVCGVPIENAKEIRKIVAKGNNAEVRGTKDGSLKIYELKLKKTVG